MRDVVRAPCAWCGRPVADAEDAKEWVLSGHEWGVNPLPWETDKTLCWRRYGFVDECPGGEWLGEHERRLQAEQRCEVALNREAYALSKMRAVEDALRPRLPTDSYSATLPLPEVLLHLRQEVAALRRDLGALHAALTEAYATEEELWASLRDARQEVCRRVVGASSVVLKVEEVAEQRGWDGLYPPQG